MIKTKILKNKVTLVTEQIPYVQSAAIGMFFNVGAVFEDQEHAGISHFIEHMMFKGTEKRTAKQIAEDFDKLGGQFNAFTSKEITCYHVKTIGTNLKKATEILTDMITNSKFDQKEMDRERSVIYEEIKMTQDTPDELAQETLTEEIFKGNPMANSILGTPESLKRINRDEMRAYYKEKYVRDHMVVSVVGNFDEKEIAEYIENHFYELNETREDPKVQYVPYSKSSRTIIKDIEQSHIFMGIESIKMSDERNFDLAVLNNILGGSMSSRLFQHIREQKGLAYSVFSGNATNTNSGEFFIYAGVAHDKIQDAILGIQEELAKLKENGVTDEEMDMAKVQIKSNYVFSQENIVSRMFGIGKETVLLGKARTPEEVLKMVDATSKESIQSMIDIVTNSQNYCKALVTNKEFNLEEL